MEEKMTPHEKRAAELFLSGAGCSQAVFCAFCDLHGIDTDTAARLTSSMGGGIGRQREVCGALSGAVLAAGLLYGFGLDHTGAEKTAHYARVREISSLFREELGSIVCREILAARMGKNAPSDAPVPEPRTAEFYSRRPCLDAVRLAARVLDGYIERNRINN